MDRVHAYGEYELVMWWRARRVDGHWRQMERADEGNPRDGAGAGPLRILMIVPQPFFTPRGTPFSVRARLGALSELGHHVDVVTYHIGDDVRFPNVRIYRTPRIPFVRTVGIGPSVTKLVLDVLLFGVVLIRVARARYDVVHTHEEAAIVGAVIAPIIGARHLYDMHSSLPQQFANLKAYNWRAVVKVFEMTERFVIRRSDAVIAICPALSDHVSEIDKECPCFVIENAV